MPKKVDHSNTMCCICGSKDTYVYNGKHIWYNHRCNKKDCTAYECSVCHKKIEYNTPGTYANAKKLQADCRNENLDSSSSSGRGFIGVQIVAHRYGIDDCNIKMDNFRFYVDLSKISGYGYSEVKTSSFSKTYGRWKFNTDRVQEYDTAFLVCMDNNWPWKDVDRLYAIPWEVVVNRNKWSISITKNPSKGVQWYEEFRIDERPFNETYHNMKLENCKILRKELSV